MATTKKKSERAAAPYRVVVGVDLSAASALALRAAYKSAAGYANAEVHVVRALGPQREARTAKAIEKADALLSTGSKQLRTFLDKEAAPAGVRLAAHVRFGAPEEVIVQVAVDVDADLVVVGTSPRSAAEKLILGSVSGRVLKAASCPVLVVKKRDHARQTKSIRVEPPCNACRALRAKTNDPNAWCPKHARTSGLPRHTYHYDSNPMGTQAAIGGH